MRGMAIRTVGDLVRRSIEAHPNETAMVSPPAKTSGVTQRLTYAELGARIRGVVGRLRAEGVKPGDRVAIFSENRAEWAIADLAAMSTGRVVVPIFATLPQDQAAFIARHAGCVLALCGNADLQSKLADVEGLRTALLDEVIGDEVTDADWAAEVDAVRPDAPATIIYTSGTTGLPKGAVISHEAVVHVPQAAARALTLGPGDRFLCFLPISHVYERVAGQLLPFSVGAAVCYSRSLAAIGADMQSFRPTVMLCVPRFLESLKDRIQDAVEKMPPLRRRLFAMALGQNQARQAGKFAPLAPLLDKVVMAKARERTGGALRFFVSGGAALAPSVAEFYFGLGLTVLQGYGLTETCGGTVVNRPRNNRYWTVGEPLEMDVRLAADGEIEIRGTALMSGYYQLPQETAEAMTGDGWFRTGDIGEWEGECLKITDRKKDIVVLANGKNIAPQPIENRLRERDLIQEVVLFGDDQDIVGALVVPRGDLLRARLGLPEDAPLVSNPAARAAIKAEIDAVNKSLAPHESVRKFALLAEPFSIEGGELTPTLKVKRKFVAKKFAAELQELFGP
jgi:long-chain acyl-CoA synthetase